MIDTIKIYIEIPKDIADVFIGYSQETIHRNNYTGEIGGRFIHDSLKGSYDTNISVTIVDGSAYGFTGKYGRLCSSSRTVLGINLKKAITLIMVIIIYKIWFLI